MQVDQGSQAFLGDAAHGAFECAAAFAAGRAEDIPHQAVGVHADQHRNVAVLDVTADQGYVRFTAIDFTRISDQAEFAEAGIDQGFADAIDVALMRHAVANEFRHGKHLHVVLAAELAEVRNAGHAAIVFHDLADNAGRDHAREPCQVNRGLGLSRAHQDSTFSRTKREDVAGTGKI